VLGGARRNRTDDLFNAIEALPGATWKIAGGYEGEHRLATWLKPRQNWFWLESSHARIAQAWQQLSRLRETTPCLADEHTSSYRPGFVTQESSFIVASE
jgi:hypothetical protein